jgi:hypothetical protein
MHAHKRACTSLVTLPTRHRAQPSTLPPSSPHTCCSDYLLSLTSDDALRLLGSPGKSGSVFFLSDDDRCAPPLAALSGAPCSWPLCAPTAEF